LPVPLAPLNHQRSVMKKIQEVFSRIGLTEKAAQVAVRETECLRDSFVWRAFRGELVPQDPREESASVAIERMRMNCMQKETRRFQTLLVASKSTKAG